jgi:hypothetical protein
MRRPLLLVLLVLTATTACTTLLGDFTIGAVETVSDGGLRDGGGGDAQTGTITPVASNVSVYLGQVAKLDGSKSTTTTSGAITYVWTMLSVPSGSQDMDSLEGATSASAHFTPDVLGTYKLSLKVSALNAPPQTKVVTVTAILPSVFYAQGTVAGDGGGTEGYSVAEFDGGFEGGSAHSVLCSGVVTTTVPNEIAAYGAMGGRAYDFWEAPAGQPSKFAGFHLDYSASSSARYTAHLYAGTSASACDPGAAGNALNLGTTNFGNRPFGSNPHFSPDGSRFVVYDNAWNIITYSSDGTGTTNTVWQYPVPYNSAMRGAADLDPSGAQSNELYFQEPPRVEWVPGSSAGLAWAIPTDSGWAIVTAPDNSNGSKPNTLMTCAGVVPREIAILSDQSVIASYRQTVTSGENLVHLTSSNGECVPAAGSPYTSVGNVSGAVATDFAVSPDETQIAFLQLDPTSGMDASAWMTGSGDASAQLPGGYVYTVPVKGGTPFQVSTTPALYGPRWIGGGTSLVFTGLVGTMDAGTGTFGLATSVVVVQPDGTAETVVAQGNGVTTFVSTSGSGACSTAPGDRGAPAAGALLSLAAIAELVRRRSRRR